MLVLVSCASLRKLPKEQFYAFTYFFERDYKNDSVLFQLKNPLMCPIRVKHHKDSMNLDLNKLFGELTLTELQDTLIKIYYPNFDLTKTSKYIVGYGDLKRTIEKNKIALPFPKMREYKVIQGYSGKYSHNKFTSKYAIDFSLKIGDTISSADNGYVVGVIEGYKKYGTSKEWRENDKSNYITIYHPQTGLYTQYVHLNHQGALVSLGDYVTKGQSIGISGMTGFTDTEHLHFNVRIPTKEQGLISTGIEFENGIKGIELKQHDVVKNESP